LKAIIKREQLPGLPDPAVRLIQMGMYSLFEISSPENKEATYLLRLSKDEFLYLNTHGFPLSQKPRELSNLELKAQIRFESLEDPKQSPITNSHTKFCF